MGPYHATSCHNSLRGGHTHMQTRIQTSAQKQFQETRRAPACPGLKNSKTDIDLMISKLNTDQLEVFNKVASAIQAQVNGTTDSNAVTVRVFVSGCGGTGKSF